MNEEEKKQKILEFIKKHIIAVISTIDLRGKPEAAVIEFSEKDNLEVIFDTFLTYRKYKNIKANPNVALVIGWDQDITVQYEGEAIELEEPELAECRAVHLTKLPKAAKFVNLEQTRYFKVIPKWIRYSDLSVNPWEVFEINL